MLKRHLVTRYDTLRQLAVKYLGNADRWLEIALANNLKNADIDHLVGQEILLPIEEPGTLQDPYRRDLLILDGDLAESPGGDLLTVGGRDNYALFQLRMFATRPGDLGRHPRKGFRVSAGDAVGNLTGPLLRLDAEELFRADPRTRRVLKLDANFVPSQKHVRIAATLEDVQGGITNFKFEG